MILVDTLRQFHRHKTRRHFSWGIMYLRLVVLVDYAALASLCMAALSIALLLPWTSPPQSAIQTTFPKWLPEVPKSSAELVLAVCALTLALFALKEALRGYWIFASVFLLSFFAETYFLYWYVAHP